MTSDETAAQRADRIWRAWNALSDDVSDPVAAISEQLDISHADVAAVVYPADVFGQLGEAEAALLAYLARLHDQEAMLRSANAALRSGNAVLRAALLDACELLPVVERLALARKYPAVFTFEHKVWGDGQ
jgi:hypothetical protein